LIIAKILLAQHLGHRAKDLALPAYTHLAATLDATHRDIGTAEEIIGAALLAVRENETALKHLRVALSIARDSRLSQREPRLLSQLVAGHCRLGVPLNEESHGRIDAVLARVKSAVGEASSECLEPLHNAAEVAFLAGHYDQAHHLLSKALKIADSLNIIFLLGGLFKPAAQLTPTDLNERNRLAASRLSSKVSMEFAEVLFSISCVFEAQGRLQEAQSTALQVLAALELANAQTTIRTSETLRLLSVLLFKDGHFGDALAYAEKSLGLLLEHHPTATDYVMQAFSTIDVIDKQLQACGYTLVRHDESRYRFSVFV